MSALRAEREVAEMVKVSIEVRSGAARFRVGVQAESMQQAVSLVAGRFPGKSGRVKFPIEAEGFFAQEPSTLTRIVGPEQAHQQAA